jgi:bifunctional non-homologous end joining protein LigD
MLEGLGLEAFPKVSGSKGLQLYVPLNTPVTYDSVTPFAKAIAGLLHRQHPDLIVSNMSKALRTDRVLIDWSQNHQKKTTVGPYSVRGKRDEPFVSLPVTWAELARAQKTGKTEQLSFSPAETLKRVKKLGDLFAPVLKKKQRLPEQFVEETAAERGKGVPPSLERYAAKRNFGKTSEPAPSLPAPSAQDSRRHFVVQKHRASHLHYDFRLEMNSVLKSWAVPKGLSTEVGVKRSAFQTEDHPLEYFTFEGTIPKGEYGGGTVMVWDFGTFDIIGGNYWKGDLKLWLSGKKLKGEWHMFRIKSKDDKPVWLIQKAKEPAKAITAKQERTSVLTGRTMEQIAKANDAVWRSKEKDDKSAPSARKTTAKPPSMPEFVEPMTAREVAELPDDGKWLYEIKLDGYRGFGIKHGNVTRLVSRKNKNLGEDFPGVVRALGAINAGTAMLDGEIVALDPDGKPSFQLLQNRKSAAGAIVYYAFDLLNLEGDDWRNRPVEERKGRLAEIVEGSVIRFSVSFDGPADRVVAGVKEMGLEGVVAKRRGSVYQSSERSGNWLKYKLSPAQEFVVGGYKRGTPLESLVVGYYGEGKLLCAGKVRQGLNPRNRKELHALFKPMLVDVCPFDNLPNSKKSRWGEGITAEQMKEIQWVRPQVVVQVRFAEWTSGGNLRHGEFQGIRHDKVPADVVRDS